MDLKELSACLRQYGLRSHASVQPLPGGHVGTAVLVTTGRGRLVVKRFSERFDITRIELAAQAHCHAALAGLAPQPLPTLDGQLTAMADGATYLLTEYAEPVRPSEADHLATALASLHEHLDSFQPSDGCTGFLELTDPPAAGLECVLQEILHPAQRDIIEWRLQILADYGLSTQAVSAVSPRWVHGDARLDNLLVTGAPAQSLFIDFDQVSRFPRAYEIARAYFATVSPDLPSHRLEATFRSFLGTYHASTPISGPDRTLMIGLYITVQAAETRSFTSPEGEVRGIQAFARSRHRKLAWIIEHRDLLHSVAEEVHP